jgi:hypothetical protein
MGIGPPGGGPGKHVPPEPLTRLQDDPFERSVGALSFRLVTVICETEDLADTQVGARTSSPIAATQSP